MIPHPTLVEAIRHHSQAGSTSTVGVVELDGGYTELKYPDYWTRIVRCAEELRARGVLPGDRIAVDMTTSLDLLIAIGGVLAAGAVVVPLRGVRRLRPGSHDHRQAIAALSVSGARWCLAPAPTASLYEQLSQPVTVLSLAGVTGPGPPRSLAPPVGLDPQSTALLQFSSGRTAAP